MPSFLTGFLGSDLQYSYRFPDLATPYDGTDSSKLIFVKGGLEIDDIYDFDGSTGNEISNQIHINVDQSRITVDFFTSSYFNAASFNGFVLTDYLNQVAPITNVTVSQATFASGFTPQAVSFQTDSISVNWVGAVFNAGTRLVLDVTFAPLVQPPLTPFGLIVGTRANGLGLVETMATFARAAYHLLDREVVGPGINDASPTADRAYDSLQSKWHMMEVSDMPLLAPSMGAGDFPFMGLRNGMYVSGNAAALAARCADALVIAFRGTNDGAEKLLTPDREDWAPRALGMDRHYSELSFFVQEIDNYVATHSDIKRVYVTGHSLGAAMVNAYMQDHPGPKYVAMTFADPGYFFIDTDTDTRIANFLNESDIIQVGDLALATPGDDNVFGGNFVSLSPLAQHNMDFYLASIRFMKAEGVVTNNILPGSASTDYDSIVFSASNATGFGLGAGDNILKGKVTGNDLTGFNSSYDDLMLGGAGKDAISGLGGNDYLIGGDGADVLTGGAGSDVLRGGGADKDDDRFVFAGGFGRDRIVDFENGVDHIDLRSFKTSYAQLIFHMVESGGSTTIDLSGVFATRVILIDGIGLAGLSAADFLF